MNVVVNVTVGKNKQLPRRYSFRLITSLSQLLEQISREPDIGNGRFYRLQSNGESVPIPFSEYSRSYIGHPNDLYYEVYDNATWEQYTQLSTAIRTGNLATVQELVPSVFDVDLIVPHDGSLLHQAVTHDRVPVVEYLLQQGANVNIENNALADAIHNRNLLMVRLLVDNGAEINRKTPGNSTVLNRAVSSQSLPIIDFLLRSGADVELGNRGRKPIHEAAETGNLEIVKMLVEAGADINQQTNGEDWYNTSYATPLMIAAMNGYFDIVDYLLKMGADYNLYDLYEMTAEDIARDHGHNGIANLIRDYSEDLIKEPEF